MQAAVHATCQEVQVAIGPPTHHACPTLARSPLFRTRAGDQHIRLSMMPPLCEACFVALRPEGWSGKKAGECLWLCFARVVRLARASPGLALQARPAPRYADSLIETAYTASAQPGRALWACCERCV